MVPALAMFARILTVACATLVATASTTSAESDRNLGHAVARTAYRSAGVGHVANSRITTTPLVVEGRAPLGTSPAFSVISRITTLPLVVEGKRP